jgi:hypothetical protein
MPNLFKIVSFNHSTLGSSFVLWLGLTLAVLSADAGSALANSAKPTARSSSPSPAAEGLPESLPAPIGPEQDSDQAQRPADASEEPAAEPTAEPTPAAPTPAAPLPPAPPRPATANNQFIVPPGLTDRPPEDTTPSEPIPLPTEVAPEGSEDSDRDGSGRDGSDRDGSDRDGSDRDGSGRDGSDRDNMGAEGQGQTPEGDPRSPRTTPSGRTPTDPFGSTRSADLGAPITTPTLRLQGAYILQGDEDTVRARAVGVYPLEDWLQVGAVVDVTDDGDFNVLEGWGVDLTELYVAAAPIRDLPNLRFIVGQIDFTSYFDRNSFAKDRSTHFFNSVFQSNPALQATTFTSRPGALLNWTITDNVEVKAGAFSSEPDLGDFAIDGFAGELGFRLENFIIRGTYVTALDGGTRTGFNELFDIDRGNGIFGTEDGDREDAWGLNAEYYIPEIGLGLFGRYGHYTNQDLDGDNTGDTYSFGINLLDLIMPDDRLGLGYGRELSNSNLRDGENPDVIEIFYDAKITPNLRVGVTFQALNEFSESIAGFRIRTDFDLIPRRSL